MKIFKYKMFTSSEEFEQWQLDNEAKIVQILPTVLNAEQYTTNSTLIGDPTEQVYMKIGVTVIYVEELEK